MLYFTLFFISNYPKKNYLLQFSVGSIKIGALETQIWNPNTFELLLTLNSTEIIFDRDLIYCAQDCLDTSILFILILILYGF